MAARHRISLHSLNRIYGPEIGNLLAAGAFCLLGGIFTLVARRSLPNFNQPE